VQKQYDHALAEMERAIALDSALADGYAALAIVLSHMGRPEEALRAAEQALRLKPNGVNKYLYVIGTAYAVAGRPEAALTPLQRSVGRYPNLLGAHLELAAVYSELGREAEAQAEAAANGTSIAEPKLDAYIAPMGTAQNAAALALARELRHQGLSIEVGDGNFRLKKSFEAADRVARNIIILGEDEVASGQITIKTFVTGEQVKVARAELRAKLQSV